MSDELDISLKLLLKERPQDYADWFIPGATYKRTLSPHLPGRKLDADSLFEVILDGESVLCHVEFQGYRDPNMAKRMWQYNTRATQHYDCPVVSVLLYLKKERNIASSPYIRGLRNGPEIHRFQFIAIKLWEEKAEILQQLGLVGLLPLLPLTQGGKNPEVVEEAITSIQARGGKSASELLSLTYILASLVFKKKVEQEWLDRRFSAMHDILQDTWAYKKIKKEGLEEGRREGRQLGIQEGLQQGRQQGLQQGLQQGRQQGLHEALQEQQLTLLEIVRGRFPAIEQQAKRTVDTITDLAVLRTMIVKLSLAQTEEAARQILLEKGMAKS